MFGLLIKDVDFIWTEQCQTTFETMKAKLSMAPILRGANWALPFHISIDAFDTAIGRVLGKKEDHESYAIYFYEQELVPYRVKLYSYRKGILGSSSCYQ
jgi:hypothetical protein